MMLRNLVRISAISLVAVGLLMVTFIGCGRREEAKEVSLEKREVLKEEKTLPEEKPIRIAVEVLVTSREGFAYYQQLLDYIGEKLGRSIAFIQGESYAEVYYLLSGGEIDVAFVCGKPYVDGHEEFGLELLVAPQAYGKTVYYSYIIVHSDSSIKNFEELQGKVFAFSDPLSNSGKLVPTYTLAKMGYTPDTFFKRYFYTYGHDKSIKAVAQRLADGAAVDSLIWEYESRINPEYTSKTKIIKKSPPHGIPPVVVTPGLDPELKERIKKVLLNVHEDEKGKRILKGMMLDKFVNIDDSAYDTIREMKDWLSKQKGKD